MSFGSCWGNLLSPSYKNVNTNADVKKATDEAFDAEFEAKKAEETPQSITEDIGGIPSEEVVEEAYKAFDIPQEILDAEKAGEEAAIKESKKRKSKKVTAETPSDENLAF
jgi:hypothetical protein